MATVGLAHAACTNVSNFNSILFPAQTSSADGFAVGDQLTITATWNAGPDTTTAYAELSVSGSAVAPITGSFPVIVIYTVSAPFGPSTLFQIENTNNVNAIAISVTCVAAQTPGTTQSDSQKLKAFRTKYRPLSRRPRAQRSPARSMGLSAMRSATAARQSPSGQMALP